MNGLQIMPEIPSAAQLGYMGSMQKTSDSSASPQTNWGRNGDTQLVHVAPGEHIVPKEVIDANPELAQIIGQAIANLGADPNRYVVGSPASSINPYTGQPEFFFKKIKRAIKKVFKKIAPVAAPIIGSILLPGVGTALGASISSAAGAAIGSAVGTKLSGGTWGQSIGAGIGSYAGGQLLSGSAGSLAGSATKAGTSATIGGALASNGLVGVAKALPNAISSAGIGNVVGAYLGSNIGASVGGMIDPPKIKAEQSSMPNYALAGESNVPATGDLNVAVPTEATSDGRPTGAGNISSLPGASYVNTVINRFTGLPETRTSSTPFTNNFNTSRRSSWGGGVSFA